MYDKNAFCTIINTLFMDTGYHFGIFRLSFNTDFH